MPWCSTTPSTATSPPTRPTSSRPAPPPVPVPPLPFYHGQMRLPGEGPIVILSETARAAHQAVHPGETIGPFKLLEATSQELAFGWQDKIIRKNLDELVDHGGASAPPPPGAAMVDQFVQVLADDL